MNVLNPAIDFQPAYVLHTRPYRETSLIVDCFTANFGRISLVAKGAKRKKSSQVSLLTPLLPIHITWSGRGELKSLRDVEVAQYRTVSMGLGYYCVMYVNELLLRLVPKEEVLSSLFMAYNHFVILASATDLASQQLAWFTEQLRRLEFLLLNVLGVGVNFHCQPLTGISIQPNLYYWFDVENGFVEATSVKTEAILSKSASEHYKIVQGRDIFLGEQLLQIGDFLQNQNEMIVPSKGNKEAYLTHLSAPARHCAKRIAHLAIMARLGDRPLKSQALLRKVWHTFKDSS
ncbi:DNA repair protein RecO [Marinibactrum halimedae]|uniref:DNA repair protein RecO n=1 Tax=Marinibactrum halimedae TaxID=1444977 RepID=A0AA37T982_9GAMM|nr:DNA repair protein RecO [Marinibactrum halimedae]MCD9459186.1 DNA repair protein RecO [Marinibactrum halimedae]GLS27257.1 DNA repair protein RecO [Marinibactrum halimedae]